MVGAPATAQGENNAYRRECQIKLTVRADCGIMLAMTHNVRFDLASQVAKLSEQTKRAWAAPTIANAVGGRLSRQNIYRHLQGRAFGVHPDTLSAYLDFFDAQGMPITVADLYVVTRTE